jgi:hypothetical protein
MSRGIFRNFYACACSGTHACRDAAAPTKRPVRNSIRIIRSIHPPGGNRADDGACHKTAGLPLGSTSAKRLLAIRR